MMNDVPGRSDKSRGVAMYSEEREVTMMLDTKNTEK